MTRQEQLKEIGEMIPLDFMSKFIIPVKHNFYKNNVSVFDNIKELKWEVISSPGRQLGAFNIKKYIYDNMIPVLDNKNKKDFLKNNSSLLLRNYINIDATLDKYKFTIPTIDLWIFDKHIAFFIIDTKIYKDNTNDINEHHNINYLSEFNKQFREFKFYNCIDSLDKISFEKVCDYSEPNDILRWLLSLTSNAEKSFLNITKKECIDSSIYNTSTNAKLMTAIQTPKINYLNGEAIEPLHEGDLKFDDINGTSILEEVPFYLASCSSLNPSAGFTNNEEYIHSLVDNGGFNIWKYSSGIIIHDSFALLGLGDNGGPIVSNMKGQFYFIYMLNLYINMQIRFIEYELIDNEFESIDIVDKYKQLQKLKNQFITKEIGIKFQENELHNSMLTALKTEDMISEITDNLMETKEITQSHLGIYVSLGGFAAVSMLEEPLTIFATEYTEILGSILIITIGIWVKIKINFIKKTINSIKDKLFS